MKSAARLEIPPYHGFELLDDKYVIVDLFNTVLTSQGQHDARQYRRVFDNLADQSSDDTDDILGRYYRRYLDLIIRNEMDD